MTTGVTLASGVVAGPGAPIILMQMGGPLIFPSSGSIANNGALTGLTALQATFASCWMTFPAGAIAAGVPAAATTFLVQMSSGTAGTIFNNSPVIVGNSIPFPSSPTAFVTTGPGAYTQTTGSNVAMLTIPIPGSIGPTGRLRFTGMLSNNGTAGNKIIQVSLGGTNILSFTLTASQTTTLMRDVVNLNANNSQVSAAAGNSGVGVSVGAPVHTALDLTTSQNLILNGQLAVATDTSQYDYLIIEAYP